ncbi:MAG: CBS domain-containing protein [Desulfobulbaceae bacterium]|jgi:CBS domain-containing protein|nr:CBS domain-containing protein [Desulfobulbaceae bacterium]
MGLNDEIENVVNWEAKCVDVNDSVRVAIRKMSDSKASALAVKVGDEVVGVLTDMDLMGCIDRSENLDETKASNCMTACELITLEGAESPCVQLDSSQSVGSALGVMNLAGVHHLLVSGEDDKSIGLVSVTDLLKLAIS